MEPPLTRGPQEAVSETGWSSTHLGGEKPHLRGTAWAEGTANVVAPKCGQVCMFWEGQGRTST